MSALPLEADAIVVGGGTAGAAVAARLVEGGREVLVLEAGPDPGPLGDPRWPADLLDASRLGTSFDWGFDSAETYRSHLIPFERARVLGGCSAHNGAVQTWGHRRDYDEWEAVAGPAWSADGLKPLFARASQQLRVRTYARAELTPWQAAWYEAGPRVGLPHLADLNDLDETVGIAPESVNIVDATRFNTAFAYIDPLRGHPGLTIVGDALVDRLLIEHDRAVAVIAIQAEQPQTVRCELVVLCGGTFGSPAVLLRSGVGPAGHLGALGVPLTTDLPGVGVNLHDQPFVLMSWEGSPQIARAMEACVAQGWAPDEQVMAKAATSFDSECFDLHLLPYSPTHLGPGRTWHAGAGALRPRSRGRVWLRSADPNVLPAVDHAFLSDDDGHDVAVLSAGVAVLRELAAQPGLRELLGREIAPGPAGLTAPGELRAYLRGHPDSYWHPVGTCAMGPASDPAAVCDGRGAVHGIDGCLVADCSLMPVIPRATTAMPAVVIGERVAELVLHESPAGAAL
jgi:choline dehydrogenase